MSSVNPLESSILGEEPRDNLANTRYTKAKQAFEDLQASKQHYTRPEVDAEIPGMQALLDRWQQFIELFEKVSLNTSHSAATSFAAKDFEHAAMTYERANTQLKHCIKQLEKITAYHRELEEDCRSEDAFDTAYARKVEDLNRLLATTLKTLNRLKTNPNQEDLPVSQLSRLLKRAGIPSEEIERIKANLNFTPENETSSPKPLSTLAKTRLAVTNSTRSFRNRLYTSNTIKRQRMAKLAALQAAITLIRDNSNRLMQNRVIPSISEVINAKGKEIQTLIEGFLPHVNELLMLFAGTTDDSLLDADPQAPHARSQLSQHSQQLTRLQAQSRAIMTECIPKLRESSADVQVVATQLEQYFLELKAIHESAHEIEKQSQASIKILDESWEILLASYDTMLRSDITAFKPIKDIDPREHASSLLESAQVLERDFDNPKRPLLWIKNQVAATCNALTQETEVIKKALKETHETRLNAITPLNLSDDQPFKEVGQAYDELMSHRPDSTEFERKKQAFLDTLSPHNPHKALFSQQLTELSQHYKAAREHLSRRVSAKDIVSWNSTCLDLLKPVSETRKKLVETLNNVSSAEQKITSTAFQTSLSIIERIDAEIQRLLKKHIPKKQAAANDNSALSGFFNALKPETALSYIEEVSTGKNQTHQALFKENQGLEKYIPKKQAAAKGNPELNAILSKLKPAASEGVSSADKNRTDSRRAQLLDHIDPRLKLLTAIRQDFAKTNETYLNPQNAWRPINYIEDLKCTFNEHFNNDHMEKLSEGKRTRLTQWLRAHVIKPLNKLLRTVSLFFSSNTTKPSEPVKPIVTWGATITERTLIELGHEKVGTLSLTPT